MPGGVSKSGERVVVSGGDNLLRHSRVLTSMMANVASLIPYLHKLRAALQPLHGPYRKPLLGCGRYLCGMGEDRGRNFRRGAAGGVPAGPHTTG